MRGMREDERERAYRLLKHLLWLVSVDTWYVLVVPMNADTRAVVVPELLFVAINKRKVKSAQPNALCVHKTTLTISKSYSPQ
jgi:hypothetical protein